MSYRYAKFEKIDPQKGYLFTVIFVKWCEEEKSEENGIIFRNTYLTQYWADFLQIWNVELYNMEGIKCEFGRNCQSGYRDISSLVSGSCKQQTYAPQGFPGH